MDIDLGKHILWMKGCRSFKVFKHNDTLPNNNVLQIEFQS